MNIVREKGELISLYQKKGYNLIFLSGDDFDKKESIEKIKNSFSGDEIDYYFKNDAEDIIESLSMKTLFGRKLFIVYDIDSFSSDIYKKIKEIISKPDRIKPNTLVLTFQNEKKIPGVENALCGKFKKIYDSDIPGWIKKYVRENGYKIEREALRFLHFTCGTNRGEIKKNIERIISVKEKRDNKITRKDVENVGFIREDTIFQLTNSIRDKKYKKALQYLLEYSDKIPVFYFINRDTRILLVLRAIMDKKKNLKKMNINKRLKMHPYFLNKQYRPAAGKMPFSALKEQFEKVIESEYRIKNGWDENSANFNLINQLQWEVYNE